jgi:hypothetical protein
MTQTNFCVLFKEILLVKLFFYNNASFRTAIQLLLFYILLVKKKIYI